MARLALGFPCDDASVRLDSETYHGPCPTVPASRIRAAAGDSRGCVVTAFESGREARVESPCIRHCTLDDDDICLGCFRSIDDICAWGGADNRERRQILERAAKRRESWSAKRG